MLRCEALSGVAIAQRAGKWASPWVFYTAPRDNLNLDNFHKTVESPLSVCTMDVAEVFGCSAASLCGFLSLTSSQAGCKAVHSVHHVPQCIEV